MTATTSGYRGRFAPSPTGPLHFGSLVAALGSWLMARRHGGAWLIRIEDLDPPREAPGASERQLATLAAFGLVSDEPVVRQSERGDLYGAALGRLLATGTAFACRCSRSDLAPQRGIHRRCVDEGHSPEPAIRLRVPDGAVAFDDAVQGHYTQNVGRDVGDFVLKRADGYWAYQLAVVVDDDEQRISHVVRGADLLDSTPRQILLQGRLGVPTPSYAHLPLVLDAHGRKLGKSEAALPVDDSDPLPALRAAWNFLGQPEHALAARGGVARILSAAQAAFEPARIPYRASRPRRLVEAG